MLVFSIHSLVAVFFSSFLLLFNLVLGGRFCFSRNNVTPFECGFDPKDSARLPFSMRFFLLAVVFLIFDIEVALLFPIVLGLSVMSYLVVVVAGFFFLAVLLLGLFHEWNEGSLSWVV